LLFKRSLQIFRLHGRDFTELKVFQRFLELIFGFGQRDIAGDRNGGITGHVVRLAEGDQIIALIPLMDATVPEPVCEYG